MECVALCHVAFEDLGLWEAEIRAHGYTVTYVDAGRPILGVCLGAQLIAHALGWTVAPAELELGWGIIDVAPAGTKTPLRHVAGVPILQWHGETVYPPADVELLASTAVTACQAFRVGSALAIQFHPEVDPESFERWLIGNFMELLGLGRSIEDFRAQTAAAADAATVARIGFIREYLRGL